MLFPETSFTKCLSIHNRILNTVYRAKILIQTQQWIKSPLKFHINTVSSPVKTKPFGFLVIFK